MTSFPLGELLSGEVLAGRERLPLKPTAVTLLGKNVRLRPLNLAQDARPLHAVSNGEPIRLGEREVEAYDSDELVWRYLFGGPFASAEQLAGFLNSIQEAEDCLPFTVFDAATDVQIGFASYTNNAPEHLKVEMGHIWYSPLAQGTKANLETSYLMLRHAFELGYRRVEWKCDALNERSRRAASRIGFRFEGIQEAHFIIKGRNRDTAWFRLLNKEWPAVQERLEELLCS